MKMRVLVVPALLILGLLASTASFGAVSFVEPEQIPLPFDVGNKIGSVTGLAKADFNGDGKLDLAAVYDVSGVGFVGIFLGEGNGHFKAPIAVQLPTGEYNLVETGGIVALDLDGDGKSDLAITATNGRDIHEILFFKGVGDGTLKPAVATVTSTAWQSSPVGLQAADLDGNGSIDLVTMNNKGAAVEVLLGNGDGTFAQPVSYAVGANPTDLFIADLNGDGAPDLVVSSYDAMNYTVLINDGKGLFGSSQASGGMQMTSIFPGDFNGDGFIDILAGGVAPNVNGVSCYTDCLTFLPGNGDGTFAPVSTASFMTGGSWPGAIHVPKQPLDIDGDGKADFITTLNRGQIQVGLGRGDGSFARRMWVASPGTSGTNSSLVDGAATTAALWGDFTGDGTPDLVVAEAQTNPRNGGLSLMTGLGKGEFAAPRVFRPSRSASTDVRNLAAGDFDGDGKIDTILISDVLDLMKGNGDGSFLTGDIYSSTPAAGRVSGPGEFYNTLRTADFDGDGKLDLVWMATGGVQGGPKPRMFMALGDGTGGFPPQLFMDYGASDWSPRNVVIADFNRDNHPDLAVWVGRIGDYTHVIGHLEVYLFDPLAKTFTRSAGYPEMDLGLLASYPGNAIAAGDFNGDGKVDLIAHSTASYPDGSVPERVIFFAGTGDGTFAQPVTAGYALPVMNDLSPADVNGDGKLDLIGAGGNGAYVLLGNGDGTFAPPSYYDTGRGAARSVAAVDFDGDGKPDIGVASGNSFVVFPGKGDGTFGAMRRFAIGDLDASNFVVADLNGDGKPDVVTMHAGDNNCVITPLLNNSGPRSDLRVSISPAANTVGLGRQMSYTISVSNNGPDTATGVSLSTTFSANGKVDSVTTTQGSCSGSSSATCVMADLASGASASIVLAASPTILGEPLWLTAGAASTPLDLNLGDNGASVPTTVTTAEPGAPSQVSAKGCNHRATVSFTPPVSDGGSAITSYTVTANPGGITASGTESPVTVTGLTNGVSYTFTVSATNSVSTGLDSPASAGAMIYPLGDLNRSGSVDISDALLSLRIAVKIIQPDQAYREVGDVAPMTDGIPQPDGNIDIRDALQILKKVVKLIDF